MICSYAPFIEPIIIGKIIDPMDLPIGYVAQIKCWHVRANDSYTGKYIKKHDARTFFTYTDKDLKVGYGSWSLDAGPYWERNDGQCLVQIIRKLTP